jgi:hypothetical protein
MGFVMQSAQVYVTMLVHCMCAAVNAAMLTAAVLLAETLRSW